MTPDQLKRASRLLYGNAAKLAVAIQRSPATVFRLYRGDYPVAREIRDRIITSVRQRIRDLVNLLSDLGEKP